MSSLGAQISTETWSIEIPSDATETAKTDHSVDATDPCEDHIRHLLAEREGNVVPQSTLVTRTAYSKAPMSKALSTLEAEDEVSRFQIGREKHVLSDEQSIDSVVFGETVTEGAGELDELIRSSTILNSRSAMSECLAFMTRYNAMRAPRRAQCLPGS